MDIGIDFDGTCVTHEFPKIGKDIGAVPVLRKIVAAGHRLVLNTMRSDVVDPKSDDPKIISKSGNYLSDAVQWFTQNEIELFGINRNPTQSYWTSSPKVYAHMYIDDAALGCPLINCKDLSDKPFVDWEEVEIMLKERGVI